MNPHSERLLEDLVSRRQLENLSTQRALELLNPVSVPVPLVYGNPAKQYIQNELPYLYCNVCGRKSYQVEYAGGSTGATRAPAMNCNAWNSAPSLFPLQYCPGVLVPSVLSTIPQLDFQLVLQERSSE